MNKIKVGIIGTGVGIRTHLKGFRLFPNDVEITAIAGSSLKRSKEFAKQYDIPIACRDYKELCNIEELDLICITAPNKFHKEMIEYAVSRHKNIICEKPMVDTLDMANKINKLIKNYDKLFIIDHQLRFNPYIKEIKKIINEGKLGRIYNVSIKQQGTGFANELAPWSWSFDSAEGGGVRLAMASHFTDLVQYLFGERKLVSITASMNPITKKRIYKNNKLKNVYASTTCNAFIMMQDELTIQYSINAGSYSNSRFDISIFGDKGELEFSLDGKIKMYLRSEVGKEYIVTPKGVYEDEMENKVSIFSGSFRYLVPEIVKAIKNNSDKSVEIAAKPKDAVYCLKVLEAIQESANSGKSVNFKEEKNKYC